MSASSKVYPEVVITREEFRRIVAGRIFNRAIREIREVSAERGLDFGLSFRTAFDESGNFILQNFDDPRMKKNERAGS